MSDSKGAAIDKIFRELAAKNNREVYREPELEPMELVARLEANEAEAKQAILAILAQEVKRAEAEALDSFYIHLTKLPHDKTIDEMVRLTFLGILGDYKNQLERLG